MKHIAKLIRFFIYSYDLRYIGYAFNLLIQKLGLQAHLPNKWIEISDYDKNLNIKINPSEHIGSRIFFNGYYEAKEFRVLKKLLTKESYVLDIGANIGAWTLLFSKMASKGKVFSFEPSKWFDVLQYNVLANACTQNVEIFQMGLGNENGIAFIQEQSCDPNQTPAFNIGSNRLLLHHLPESNAPIEMMTLDDWSSSHQLHQLDWIKLDTEGMEYLILKGALQTLKKFRPNLLVEFNPTALLFYGTSIHDLTTLLQLIGYTHFYEAGRKGTLSAMDLNMPWQSPSKNIFCSCNALKP